MTPRTLGRFEWWLDRHWQFALYRCHAGPFRWFAFLGPLCVWRLR